ncbi:MAG: pantetheine-phosphate adenylyltransferase [Patescibacteria group bacterium]|jgi:pantetheine-phosphate adenylyltransferase
MKNKIALVVGRFQPFHKGHLFLIKKALEKADRIIIGIGSANITDENNPIDYETRKKVIKAVFYKEGIEEKLSKIVPLDDFFNDEKWLFNLRKQTGKFDLALGNNEWTNKILKKAGYKVLEVDYFNRKLYEGWRIRKLIKEGKRWQDRVPKYLIKAITDYGLWITSFNYIVVGGTFDNFHKGHETLISKAFEVGKKVVIGIAEKELYKNKLLNETIESYEVRKKSVSEFLKKKNWLSRAKIITFSHFTGGADKEKNIDAIVVSKETYQNALKINQLREKNRLKKLKIIMINDILAEDGKIISSERIRAGEIDREGHNFQFPIFNFQKEEMKMPEILRTTLQKPLGKIFDSAHKVIKFIKLIKPIQIIAVGDIVVNSMLKNDIHPDVKIIDFKSRRQILTDVVLNSFQDLEIPKQIRHGNKPGTINLKTSEIIKEKIKLAIYKKEKYWIVIDGEEDLLALPAILFAPLGSLVLYGHWEHGIIAVKIDEKIKNKVREIVKKFN